MRLFVAIPLPAAVIDELSTVSVQLRREGDGLRWSAPESWHITLQFLGTAGAEQCESTVARLRELRSPKFPIRLDGLEFFDRAGVFYAGVRITPELLSLHKRVVAATSSCGFVSETRPYQPHITLARSKGSAQGQGLVKLKTRIPRRLTFTPFVAQEFVLYESFLGLGGARHEARERFPLDSR